MLIRLNNIQTDNNWLLQIFLYFTIDIDNVGKNAPDIDKRQGHILGTLRFLVLQISITKAQEI